MGQWRAVALRSSIRIMPVVAAASRTVERARTGSSTRLGEGDEATALFITCTGLRRHGAEQQCYRTEGNGHRRRGGKGHRIAPAQPASREEKGRRVEHAADGDRSDQVLAGL